MQDAKELSVLLVGSVPLGSSRAVFEAVGTKLGKLIRRIPDGETGARKDWIVWQADVLKNAKGLEPGPSHTARLDRFLQQTSFRTIEKHRRDHDPPEVAWIVN